MSEPEKDAAPPPVDVPPAPAEAPPAAAEQSPGEWMALAPTARGEDARRPGWLGRLFHRPRRERQLAALQSGFNELVDLSLAIRTHMATQAETQQRLVKVIETLPTALTALDRMGQTAAQQTEALGEIRRHLEHSVKHDERLADSMHRFNETLGTMNQASRSSADTIRHMADRAKETEALLKTIVERSERRLFGVIGLLGIIVLVLIGSVLYFGTRGGATPAEPVAPVQPALPLPAPPEPAAEALVPADPEPTPEPAPEPPDQPIAPAPETDDPTDPSDQSDPSDLSGSADPLESPEPPAPEPPEEVTP